MATAHQLARLIDGVKDANDWSDPDLVRNAKEKGHVLSKSNISRFRNPVVSIKGEVILALAAGLRVAPSQVAVAAIESMGVHLPQHELPTPEQAVQLDTTLSSRDKNSVLALLRHLRNSAAAAGTSAEARPPQEAALYKAEQDWAPGWGDTPIFEEPRVDRDEDGQQAHDL